MDTVECPYCEKDNEIEITSDWGLEEDVAHEHQCEYCSRNFVFTTHTSYSFDSRKADCLNGVPHKFGDWRTAYVVGDSLAQYRYCDDCGLCNEREIPRPKKP